MHLSRFITIAICAITFIGHRPCAATPGFLGGCCVGDECSRDRVDRGWPPSRSPEVAVVCGRFSQALAGRFCSPSVLHLLAAAADYGYFVALVAGWAEVVEREGELG